MKQAYNFELYNFNVIIFTITKKFGNRIKWGLRRWEQLNAFKRGGLAALSMHRAAI